MTKKKVGFSLFWRTFALLLLLLAAGVLAWAYTLHEFDRERPDLPRQLGQLVGVTASALQLADRAQRPALLRSVEQRTGLMLRPHPAADAWTAAPPDSPLSALQQALKPTLGNELLMASNVNGMPGAWLGMTIDREPWWIKLPATMLPATRSDRPWLWLALAVAITLLGSALIARLINRPLRDLSFAASRIRGGEYDSRLDETTITSEIREVNMGFNRMARELAKVEEDRAVMLAGISHDLRTPLARLRLETEMSVAEEDARINMASDIDQLDAIIDKFMDYARPGATVLKPVLLSRLIDREAATFRDPSEIRITSKLAIDLEVLADEVELARVFANLFENARRYGRGTDTGIAMVNVNCVRAGGWVIITVRDNGPGVAPEKLGQLTTPFFRGDAARTAATGAGLGLAIVEKSMQRMGGQVEISNAPEGGLMVHLRLRLARQTGG